MRICKYQYNNYIVVPDPDPIPIKPYSDAGFLIKMWHQQSYLFARLNTGVRFSAKGRNGLLN